MLELRLIGLRGEREIGPGDDLIDWIAGLCAAQGVAFGEGDVLVLAQKIVSKSEGRRVALAQVEPSPPALRLAEVSGKDARLAELILRESSEIVRATPQVVVARHRTGAVLANAGIDRSNVRQDGGETVLLWPADPDASALRLHRQASARFGCHLPVVINDSLGRAWRRGTVGTAIGAAGMACLSDQRGRADRHGYALVATEVGAADELAAAASIVMGQADESIPAVLVRGARYARADGRAADLVRPLAQDLFR
ncbi:coenzyme F420-0:L-glutamate ligase [Pigmentiphaga soli]|uniref:Coenzyme F420-0:L-glutamate ligase n=1 Tax=Pigmentiphaga soli TaxID=1007095 RepID=A0ABP8GEM5_9BURK